MAASFVDLPTTFPEERSLDAHMCRIGGQNNADAVYEQALANYDVILHTKQANSSGWYGGPYPIPMRLDRDGFWRSPSVSPLIASTAANKTINAMVIPWWYEPSLTLDIEQNWTADGTATLKWQTPATITITRGFNPEPRLLATGSDPGLVRFAWLIWKWGTSTSSSSWFGGFHLAEQV
jgi:hypothetical protein